LDNIYDDKDSFKSRTLSNIVTKECNLKVLGNEIIRKGDKMESKFKLDIYFKTVQEGRLSLVYVAFSIISICIVTVITITVISIMNIKKKIERTNGLKDVLHGFSKTIKMYQEQFSSRKLAGITNMAEKMEYLPDGIYR